MINVWVWIWAWCFNCLLWQDSFTILSVPVKRSAVGVQITQVSTLVQSGTFNDQGAAEGVEVEQSSEGDVEASRQVWDLLSIESKGVHCKGFRKQCWRRETTGKMLLNCLTNHRNVYSGPSAIAEGRPVDWRKPNVPCSMPSSILAKTNRMGQTSYRWVPLNLKETPLNKPNFKLSKQLNTWEIRVWFWEYFE